jgi:nitronate monooxygenase
MRTRLTDAFGIQHPIICAPMALITGGRLAAAVSNAGGLGIVGGGYAGILGGEPDLKQELAYVQGHKFGIGFITWRWHASPQCSMKSLAIRRMACFCLLAIQGRLPGGSNRAARS